MTQTSSAKPTAGDTHYHHGDLRHALIAAALSLLTEEQNWDFSLREVARRAGVSHNAPYNHFRSKQELLAAVAAAGFDLLRVRMQSAAAGAETAAEALKAIGAAYVGFGTANPAHYRLMFGTALPSASGSPSSAVEKPAETAKAVLVDLIRRGTEEGRLAASPQKTGLAVLSAWALVHGLTLLLLDGLAADELGPAGSFDAERIAEQATQMLLDGLGFGGG